MAKPSNFAQRVEAVELALIATALCVDGGGDLLPQVEAADFDGRARGSTWGRLRELRAQGDLDVLSAQTDPEVDQEALAAALALEESLGLPSQVLAQFRAAVRARAAISCLRSTVGRLEKSPLAEDAVSERLMQCQHAVEEIQGLLQSESRDVSMRADAEALRASLHEAGGQALSLGVESLDDAMDGGMKPGSLTLVLGHSGHGKSCFGLQASVLAGLDQVRTLYVSTEMGGPELVARAAAWMGEWKESGFMSQLRARYDKAEEALDEAAKLPIEVNDQIATVGLAEARVMRGVGSGSPFGLVVLDFLQMFKGPGEQEHERLAQIAYDAKRLAQRARIPVLAMVQPKRGDTDPSGPPSMHEIRGSSTIQNAADTIISVYADHRGNPGEPYEYRIRLAKARNGVPGELRGKFQLGAGTYRIDEIKAQSEVLVG